MNSPLDEGFWTEDHGFWNEVLPALLLILSLKHGLSFAGLRAPQFLNLEMIVLP